MSYLEDSRPPGEDQGAPPAPRFYVAAFVQVGILVLLTLRGVLGLVGGTQVRLQTAPLDPRDFFRGDHVVLTYQVSRVPRRAFTNEDEYPSYRGQQVYVRLVENPRTKLWQIESAGAYPQGGVEMVGNVVSRRRDELQLEYGIESYFVEENTGRELEARARRGRVVARIHVSPNGSAAIESIED